jgi:hypothetical protein
MAKIKAVYENEADIPANAKDLFVQAADGRLKGKWVLDADAVEEFGVADTRKLTSALASERTSRDRLEGEVRSLKEAIGDMDITEAKKALERVRKAGGDLTRDEAVQAAIASATGEMKKKLDAEVSKHSEKAAKLAGTVRKLVVQSDLRAALVKAGVKPSLLDLAVKAAEDSADVDGIDEGSPRLVFLDDKREKRYSSSGQLMTADEFASILRERTPDLFQGPGAEGSGRTGDVRGGGQQRFRITADEMRKNPNEYQRRKEEAAKVGQTLEIVG